MRWMLEEVGCPLRGQFAGAMVKHQFIGLTTKRVETL
jgi:hypothetical protein